MIQFLVNFYYFLIKMFYHFFQQTQIFHEHLRHTKVYGSTILSTYFIHTTYLLKLLLITNKRVYTFSNIYVKKPHPRPQMHMCVLVCVYVCVCVCFCLFVCVHAFVCACVCGTRVHKCAS